MAQTPVHFSGKVVGARRSVGDYSAIVMKQDVDVWAEDRYGKTIAEGEAGVDDLRVIQTAVDRGGRIYIAEGRYILNDRFGVIVGSNTQLIGAGIDKTILQLADNVVTDNYGYVITQARKNITVDDPSIENVLIANMTLDGNIDNQPYSVRNLHLKGHDIKIERVKTVRAGDMGISVLGDGVSPNVIDSCIVQDFVNQGIHISLGKGNIVTNNVVRDSRPNPDTWHHFIIAESSKYSVIANNHIYINIPSASPTCYGIKPGAHATVVGNVIKYVGDTTPDETVKGIQAHSTHITITGNYIEGVYDGISIYQFPGSGLPSDLTIQGNILKDCVARGVFLYTTTGNYITNATIAGNVFYGCPLNLREVNYSTVEGNTFKNTLLHIEGNYNQIVGNVFNNPGENAVEFYTAGHCTFTGNRVIGITELRYASYNEFVGNYFGFFNFFTQGEGNLIAGNIFSDKILLNANVGEINKCVIEDNVFKLDGADWGVDLKTLNYDMHNIVIRGNKFVGSVTYNVIANTGDHQAIGVVIEENDFRDIVSEKGYSLIAIGSLTNPIIRRNKGFTTENPGTAYVTGDGTTTTFTVDIAHGLVKDKVACKITLDRAGSVDKVYLVDTDGDGFKETVRVQVTFDTAPADGETVPIFWSAEVVEE